jgi:hypothetical protein
VTVVAGSPFSWFRDVITKRIPMTPVSVKAAGKEVEAAMEITREHMETGSLEAYRKQVVGFGIQRIKTVTEPPLDPNSRTGFSQEILLRAATIKVRESVLSAAEDSEDEASTLSDDYRRGHTEGRHAEATPPDWSPGVQCDLCEQGASLSLGAWYSWCCGNPSLACSCSFDDLQ